MKLTRKLSLGVMLSLGACNSILGNHEDQLISSSEDPPSGAGGTAGSSGTVSGGGTKSNGGTTNGGKSGAGTAGSTGPVIGDGGTIGESGAGGSGAGTGGGTGGSGAQGGGDTGPLSCGETPSGASVSCDELMNGTAINFPGGKPQGTCAAGMKTCENGKFGPCLNAVPPAQTDCSSATDNDCDGKPDNTECGVCVKGATQACYDGPEATKSISPCKPGTQTCVLDASGKQTVWGPCTGEVTPAAHDTCDSGNDATCNGTANEGCTCLNGQTGTCAAKLGSKGSCAAGTTSCANGAWGACSVSPAAHDTCDSGNDATCNGTANEGCACLNGHNQTCSTGDTSCTGSQTCSTGAFGACANVSCTDFPVADPTTGCTVGGANPPSTGTCTIPVCPAGYDATGCTATATAGTTCTYAQNPQNKGSLDLTAAKVAGPRFGNCNLSACTCRRDGF